MEDINKIDIYINMLNNGYKIKTIDKEHYLEGTDILINYFWNNNKDKIIEELFNGIYKDNNKYDKARKSILKFLGYKTYDDYINKVNKIRVVNKEFARKLFIYISMLNSNYEIVTDDKEHYFDGTDILINNFWNRNRSIIIDELFNGKYQGGKFDKARKNVLNYLGYISYEDALRNSFKMSKSRKNFKRNNNGINKIEIFINMINNGYKISSYQDRINCFEGTNIKINFFWNNNKKKVIEELFNGIYKDNNKYDNARKSILNYFGYNKYEEIIDNGYKINNNLISYRKTDKNNKLDKYINMLNNGYKINSYKDEDNYFIGTNIKINYFWINNKMNIINELFKGNYIDSKYNKARESILNYLGYNSYEEAFKNKFVVNKPNKIYDKKVRKIDLDKMNIYINMLNNGYNIKSIDSNYFEGTDIIIKNYWQSNKNKIIIELFNGIYKDNKYDRARRNVLDYLGYSDYEDALRNGFKINRRYKVFPNKEEIKHEEIKHEEIKQENNQVEEYISMANDEDIINILFSDKFYGKKYDNIKEIIVKSLGYDSYKDYSTIGLRLLRGYIQPEDRNLFYAENLDDLLALCTNGNNSYWCYYFEYYKMDIIRFLFGTPNKYSNVKRKVLKYLGVNNICEYFKKHNYNTKILRKGVYESYIKNMVNKKLNITNKDEYIIKKVFANSDRFREKLIIDGKVKVLKKEN